MLHPPIDTQFYAPRLPVNIIALPNSDYETHALRQLLEMFNCVVTIHWIGTPSDFLTVLGQGETAPPYLVICGHGNQEQGYYLGQYADFIDTSMLDGDHMPAAVIAPVVNLPGCTVLSTACEGGSAEMGQAFTGAGKIGGYIACRSGPDAEDMAVFLVNFFFQVRRKGLSTRDAWLQAVRMVDQPAINEISLYHPGGAVEHYTPAAEPDQTSLP